ncbi:MAG TPA: cupin domain-containing protein [Kiloniellales bacterium]|nr:cupin domain-containing protein [Kiloniellales bacterium]
MFVEKTVLAEKFDRVNDYWDPKRVGSVDDYDVKVVKILGDFVWHSHKDEDELFLVVEGAFRMDFRDAQVEVEAGEFIVVPKGIEHKPFAAEECKVLLFERRGVINTGDAPAGALTRGEAERI